MSACQDCQATSVRKGKLRTSSEEGRPVDLARSEAVEKELDAFIERRSRQKGPEEESELWPASVDAYNEKRRQLACLEWHAFHCLQALIDHHEEQAAKLMDVEELQRKD